MRAKLSPKKDATARDGEKERHREGGGEESVKGKGHGRGGGAHPQLSEGRHEEEERGTQKPNQVCGCVRLIMCALRFVRSSVGV